MAGRRAQVARWRQAPGEAADLLRRDRQASHIGIAAQDRCDLRFALFEFERAGARAKKTTDLCWKIEMLYNAGDLPRGAAI